MMDKDVSRAERIEKDCVKGEGYRMLYFNLIIHLCDAIFNPFLLRHTYVNSLEIHDNIFF